MNRTLPMTAKSSQLARFDDMYEAITETGCWIWLGRIEKLGYGIIWADGRDQKAHRVSYERVFGPIPDGLIACHACDVRCCVNPRHIFLGTYADNVHDMYKKGRQRPSRIISLSQRGELSHRAKLSAAQVAEIKTALLSKEKHRDIAKRYGISRPAVSMINTGKTWSTESC